MRELESRASDSARNGCIRQVARALPAAQSTVNTPARSTPRFVVTLERRCYAPPSDKTRWVNLFPVRSGWTNASPVGSPAPISAAPPAPSALGEDPYPACRHWTERSPKRRRPASRARAVLWTGPVMGKPYRPKDHYFQQAKRQGLRARSAFKLEELAKRFSILRPGARVLDLGAAPGGFLQIIADAVGAEGLVLGIDIVGIQPIPKPQVRTVVLDVMSEDFVEKLRSL